MHTATVDKTKLSTVVLTLNYWCGGNKRYSTTLSSRPQKPLMFCVGPKCGLDIPDPSDKWDMGKVT
jgi:hypothetical protein